MKVHEEKDVESINEKCFPYENCVILKINCKVPLCHLDVIAESKSKEFEIITSGNKNENEEKEDPSPEKKEKAYHLQLFYENTINFAHNPRLVQICSKPRDMYDEDLAEIKYLYSKPAAFIILGKPSPDNMKFGKKLAVFWNCIYIDPITCFNTDSDDKISPAIVWCQKYLSEGKAIPSEMVMRVMEQRALSDEAMHRGFVMVGLPFAQQNGEPSAQEQMHMIFSWPMDPKIFIYVTCPNVDVISKSQQLLYDTTTGNYINKNVFSSNKDVLLVFGHEPRVATTDHVTDDVFKEIEEEKALVSENDIKHLIVMPEPNIQYILPRFQQAALPPVELYVAQIHPQYVIRVDGRTTPSHMLMIVKARIEALPLQPVCEPVPMYKPKRPQTKEQIKDTETVEGEFEEEEEEEATEMEEDEFPMEFANLDEAYQELRSKDTVGIKYKWQKSNWGVLCPVSLNGGNLVDGDPKYSVRFLNKIYFLSSPETQKAFLKNPRIYLYPPKPQIYGRVIIVGHELAGKSSVARYLSHVFNAEVINIPSLIEEEKKKNKKINIQGIQEAALKEILHKVNEERQNEYAEAEKQRKAAIENWKEEQINAIKALNIPEFNEYMEYLEDMFPESEEYTSPPINFQAPLIPQLTYARCRWLLNHPQDLLKYLPDELKFPSPLPMAASQEDPEVKEHVERAEKEASEEMKKDLEPKKLGEILVQKIREGTLKQYEKESFKNLGGGWIIDNMPIEPEVWQALTDEKITPEVVLSLQDHSPEHKFLKTRKIIQLQEGEFEEEFEGLEEVNANGEQDEEEVGGPAEEEETEKEIKRYESQEEVIPSEIGPDSKEVLEYEKKLSDFDEKWNSFQGSITSSHPPINIDVSNKNLDELLIEVGRVIEAFYVVSAEPFTDEDRDEERVALQNIDEMEMEEEDQTAEDKDILKKRRMGETQIYCPVAYQPNQVRWKGKDDLLAKYKGKVYTFSSEEAMEKFMEKPWVYVKRYQPEAFFPPLRICVVGPAGSGKTSIGKLLARTYGLIHKDFSNEINKTILPKNTPVGRKVKYLEGRFLKGKSNKTKGSRHNEDQSPLNDGEEEDPDAENKINKASIEQYLEGGTPMPDIILQKLLIPLWNEERYRCNGFVLSGFPWHPEDIDTMKSNYLIPDLIINLSVLNGDIAKEHLLKEMKEFAEKEAAKRKRKAEKEQEKLQAALRAADSLKDSSLRMEMENIIMSHLEKALPIDEDDLIDGSQEEEEKEERDVEEEEEDLQMQYEEEIQEWFANDLENLENIKTLAEEENINWLDFRNDKEMQDVCLQIVHKIQPIKLQGSISLEQTFPITFDEAEQLIESGYYFMSQFGRWCPVQLSKGEIPVLLFTPMKQRAQVFPVNYRRYIYFIGGEENLDLFQKNPLKYVTNVHPLPCIPIKIAIIGPPESGKTTLANRLSKEMNLKIITIGQAIRYVLKDLSWTELGIAVEDILKQGKTVPMKMALRCVEAAAIDPRSSTQGHVLDGFPVLFDQIQEMSFLNLFPYLIIYLDCTFAKCHARLQSEDTEEVGKDENEFSRSLPFSTKLLKYKYNCWHPEAIEVMKKLTKDYDNLVTLDADHVVWWLYDKTTEEIYRVMKSIYNYYDDVIAGKPASLECMCVTPEEFQDRQSKYLYFCPVCLMKGRLRSGGMPPNKTGLVQYKVHYYWLCEKHLKSFLKRHEDFLPPANEAELPDTLPRLASNDKELELANDGYCIVTYVDNLPDRIVIRGAAQYAAEFGEKKYLFANVEERDKFLSDPVFYSQQKMCMLPLKMPELNIHRFPTLGFLEQTVSNYIHSSLLGVASDRPKYPGLPLDLSATIYLGYNLKLINPHTSAVQIETLIQAQENFLQRCKILRKLCHKTKIRNPLLQYPSVEENAKALTIIDHSSM